MLVATQEPFGGSLQASRSWEIAVPSGYGNAGRPIVGWREYGNRLQFRGKRSS